MEAWPNLVRMAGGRKHPSTCLSLGSGFVRFNQIGNPVLKSRAGKCPTLKTPPEVCSVLGGG